MVDAHKRLFEAVPPPSVRVGAAGFLVPPRTDEPELLDLGVGSLDDVRFNLDEMWRLGAMLGGLRGLTAHLLPILTDAPRRNESAVTIADLGTGGARLPVFLADWARRNGSKLRVVGLDLSARNLTIAQENVAAGTGIQLVRGDVTALPFAAGSVDVFTSSLFLHHFAPDALAQFLRETYRIARRAIVMNDITRGTLPLAAFRIVQPLFARHELTRRDGMTSIRRAYTPDELLQIAREAGLAHARVHRHFPWRMTLVADKADV